ncbi:Zn-ribbon domain-containing OB-fold protein [Chloroflexia bacterium SDU3-3]|nr:Zn-ribbon domain-containing OB-fold protein [Chloroflexia bacterium SDU3-3]
MDLAKHWRLNAQRYRLEGQRHAATGEVRFPPVADAGEGWEPYALRGTGTLFSFSVVRQAPEGYEQPYYILGMIALDDGPVVTAQLTDCNPEQASIGMPVEMVTRKLRDLGEDGLLVYGYKFRPRLGL